MHAVRVSAAQARGMMERHRLVMAPLAWLSRGRVAPKLKALELVYVPHWVCRFRLVAKRGTHELHNPAAYVLVNALTGECGQLVDSPQFHAHSTAHTDIPLLPSLVPQERALQRATKAQAWNLIMQGTRRKWQAIQVESLETFLAYVPFWVGYFMNDAGRVWVKVVHGIAGVLEKHTVVVAILRGLQTLEALPE